MLPILLQVVEKANSQPTQVALATEALSAACLLLKLSQADIQAGSHLRHPSCVDANRYNLGTIITMCPDILRYIFF